MRRKGKYSGLGFLEKLGGVGLGSLVPTTFDS